MMKARGAWIAVIVLVAAACALTPAMGQSRGGQVRIMMTVDAEGGIDPHKRITSNAEVMDDQMYDTLIQAM